jgi:hypothetical protein
MHLSKKRIYMKKTLFTLIICSVFINTYAQTKNDLPGKWRLGINDTILTLTKKIDEGSPFHEMGRFLELKSDGTYNETASARCGLDDDRYHYTGKWKYTTSSKMLELTEIRVINDRPGIYHHYKVSTSGKILVLSLENNQLKTKIIKPWEKVTAKKQGQYR